MTAKIKLNAASGGGSVALQVPSSFSNNRVHSLPDVADGTILTTKNPISGTTVQRVQTATHTRTDTTSTTFVSTAHTVTITPIFANSKILVNFSVLVNTNGTNHRACVDVYRSIAGATATGIAPVGSNQTVGANNNSGFFGGIRADNSRLQAPTTINYLDSPSYTLGNSIVYTLYVRSTTGNTVEVPSSSNEEPCISMVTEIAA
tara:strand:+ start:657 stop:1268 length:612 start_codon:yes stop_codon:yes gene_type:complete